MQSLTMLWLLAFAPTLAVQDEEPRAPREQFETLLEDWKSFVAELRAGPAELESDEARQRFYQEGKKRERELYARALGLASDHPHDTAAVDALVWVVYQGQPPERETALKRIIGDHIRNPRLKPALSDVSMRRVNMNQDSPLYESMLRSVMETNPDRETQGLACFRLGQLLRLRADALQRLEQFPTYYRRVYERYGLGPEEMQQLRLRTPEDLNMEAEKLFERTIKEFPHVEDLFYPGRDDVSLGTLEDGARKELYELRHLAVGRVAPEVEGEDVDGRPMKLSDHRGKVSVIVFWGTWCGPCMQEVPHERSLVERLKDEPFVLLGVNGGDEDRERVKQVMQAEGISWRSWWDGKTQDGPIATRWNVDVWPTLYVLDPAGVIRYKDIRGEQLDVAVDTLLKEMEAGAATHP